MPGLFGRRGESPEVDAKIDAALRAAAAAKKIYGGPRGGIPNGWTRAQVTAANRRAEWQSRRIVNYLWRNGLVIDEIRDLPEDDAGLAKEALRGLIEMARNPATKQEVRRGAFRDILDFCKQKPAQKSDVTLNSAESFLDAVYQDAVSNMGRPKKGD